MMQNWFQAVCRTAVFIICSQVLIHCRPDSSYEKYLKMLVSAMILSQLLAPVSRILTGSALEETEERIQWFGEQMSGGAEADPMEESGGTGGDTQEHGDIRVRIAPVRWEAEGYDEE